MSRTRGRRLSDVSRIPLDDLADRDDLGKQIAYVKKRVTRSGTSISGYNGAGGVNDPEVDHGGDS